ncbi:hypothetical protein HYW46_01390 [Candidatus Daviesbacteria bacterium]|nr:hypothetical protein [Candidatus Daviesbacteria bacterium]
MVEIYQWVQRCQKEQDRSKQSKLLGQIINAPCDKLDDLAEICYLTDCPNLFRLTAIDRVCILAWENALPLQIALEVVNPLFKEDKDPEIRLASFQWLATFFEDDMKRMKPILSRARRDSNSRVRWWSRVGYTP